MNVIVNFLFIFWCLPQNFIGFIMSLFYKKQNNFIKYNNRVIIFWDKKYSGCSMGRYIFIPERQNNTYNFLTHEYGHTIQSLIFGPTWFIFFGLESILWYQIWRIITRRQQKNNQNLLKYYVFYTEKNANYFGEKHFNHEGINW